MRRDLIVNGTNLSHKWNFSCGRGCSRALSPALEVRPRKWEVSGVKLPCPFLLLVVWFPLVTVGRMSMANRGTFVLCLRVCPECLGLSMW